MQSVVSLFLAAAFTLAAAAPAAAQWEPKRARVMTRWAADVDPQNVLPEYPRPQLRRDNWQNLNGLWDYAIAPRDAAQPQQFAGQILVPFPVESALSGVMQRVGKDNLLWYRRSFELPAGWADQRVLLHFGAVDWETTVYVNGKQVGTHQGGYDPFTFDITDAINRNGSNEIVVSVWDPTTDGDQPHGKQHNNPHSIWYTPVTGIWQTVWLEPVPQSYIGSLRIEPDFDRSLVRVTANVQGAQAGEQVAITVSAEGQQVAQATGAANQPIEIPIQNPRHWSPDSPFLYDLSVSLARGDQAVDAVDSYFGLRKIALGKDEQGINRILLNDKFIFQYGPLDQGYWPDGLYTAPTDAALLYDLEITKELGFNMTRKHIKVEPARWYYHCDRLGLLVWQDMPSGDTDARREGDEMIRTEESARMYERELKAMIDTLYNHPSIIMWIPFNEGWGQFETVRITNWVKEYDPSRLVNNASGWWDHGAGDLIDFHVYPGPASPTPTDQRAAVLGEFGGLGLAIPGKTWQDEGNWGYRSYETSEALGEAYLSLLDRLRLLIGNPGLSAAVYTQIVDVEGEINGLLTYDREMIKFDPKRIAEATRKLYLPPPRVRTIVATAREQAAEWRYTTDRPQGNWHAASFNDSRWKTGKSGFGTHGTPGATIGTEWNTSDIWLRRTVEIDDLGNGQPALLLHHDEDAEVFINGQRVAQVRDHTSDYQIIPLRGDTAKALKRGRNTIAIHCKQTTGGQFIDLGIVMIEEQQ